MTTGWFAMAWASTAQAAQPEELESPLPGGIAEVVRFLFSAVPQWLQIVGAAAGLALAAWLVYHGWRRRYDIWEWLYTRSASIQVLLGVLVVGVLVGAGWFGQRAWEYTQHSNAFCTACHVMAEPFQEFQRSEHAGLQCHDCHQQSIYASMRQVYLWVADRPEDIGEHAPVANDVCTSCHVEGDPERWRQIERTAGHRVHLASDSLQDVQCVECHAASVHRFAPSKATCGQAGCHTEVDMRLGGMSNLTVHCVACHDFTRPTSERMASGKAGDRAGVEGARPDTLTAGLLRPERRLCASCHAMRSMLTDFPADDPHDGECAACHDPHEQEESARAVASCTTGGCHTPLDTAANLHHQLEADVVSGCTECHSAHSFEVGGESCLNCHEEIFRTSDAGRAPDARPAEVHARVESALRVRSRTGFGPGSGGGPSDPFAGGAERAPPPGTVRSGSGGSEVVGPTREPRTGRGVQQDTSAFAHEDHRDLDCLTCHQTETGVAGVTRTTEQWCASCHHEASSERSCISCHSRAEVRRYSADVNRTMRFSVGEPRSRSLPFSHEPHDTIACTSCHSGRPELSAADVSCAECHEEHHTAESACRSCHARAPAEAHPIDVHLTCSGSGCHDATSVPVHAAAQRDRNVCVGCHQEQVDHRTGQECAYCHVLPETHGEAASVDGVEGEERAPVRGEESG